MTLFRLLFASLLMLSAVDAADYHVAPNGDDTNSGTPDRPFRTLRRAVAAAGPGDFVIVGDGRYGSEGYVTCNETCNENRSPVDVRKAGAPSAPITIVAEHRWGATLDCELRCDSYFDLGPHAAYITIQDFVITRGFWGGIHSNADAHHIVIRGNRFEYIGNRASSSSIGITGIYTGPNSHDFVVDGNIFHDIGRTNPVGNLDHGLYLHGWNFTVVNNVFYSFTNGWAIQTANGLSDVLIANNTFAFQNPSRNGHILLWQHVTNVSIRNNIFYRPRTFAIVRFDSQVDGCDVDHNLVFGADLISDGGNCSVAQNLAGDPELVDLAASPFDFRPRPGSPAIGAGIAIPDIADDADGKRRRLDGRADLGAYGVSAPIIKAATPGHRFPRPQTTAGSR